MNTHPSYAQCRTSATCVATTGRRSAQLAAIARPPGRDDWTPSTRLQALAGRADALADILEDEGDLDGAQVAGNLAAEILRVTRGEFGRLA